MTIPEPLKSRYVMQIRADIDPMIAVGKSDYGQRQFIPIIGGAVTGDKVNGEVLPGADWQLLRQDGVLEIEAIYAIRTQDNVVINVRNVGIVSQIDGQPYVRTQPRFQGPEGPYDWLNKKMFLATITPAPDGSHVVVQVFEVL